MPVETVQEDARRRGFQDHTVETVIFQVDVICFPREVWVLADGSPLVAPMPEGVVAGGEQYGVALKRFIVMLY